VFQTPPGDSLLVSEFISKSVGELTSRLMGIDIQYISPSHEPPAPFNMLSINRAASVPIHLGRRMISPSRRTSHSASSTATVAVAGFLKGNGSAAAVSERQSWLFEALEELFLAVAGI